MPKPSFDVALKDGSYQCTLTMPPNAAFRSIVGPPSNTCNLAKQLVSLEACKKLHQLGELNDHLLPTEEPTNIDTAVTDGKCLSGPGMGLIYLKSCTLAYIKISWSLTSLSILLSFSTNKILFTMIVTRNGPEFLRSKINIDEPVLVECVYCLAFACCIIITFTGTLFIYGVILWTFLLKKKSPGH